MKFVWTLAASLAFSGFMVEARAQGEGNFIAAEADDEKKSDNFDDLIPSLDSEEESTTNNSEEGDDNFDDLIPDSGPEDDEADEEYYERRKLKLKWEPLRFKTSLGGGGIDFGVGLTYLHTPQDEEQDNRFGFKVAIPRVWVQAMNIRGEGEFFIEPTFGIGQREEALVLWGFRKYFGWHSDLNDFPVGAGISFSLLAMGATSDDDPEDVVHAVWAPHIGAWLDVWQFRLNTDLQGTVGVTAKTGRALKLNLMTHLPW